VRRQNRLRGGGPVSDGRQRQSLEHLTQPGERFILLKKVEEGKPLSRIAVLVVVFAVVGLVVGYFLFAKVAGQYVKPTTLISPAGSRLGALGQQIAGIPRMRTNILLAGAVGAAVGLVVAVAGRRR
jgi:hypothetical protein